MLTSLAALESLAVEGPPLDGCPVGRSGLDKGAFEGPRASPGSPPKVPRMCDSSTSLKSVMSTDKIHPHGSDGRGVHVDGRQAAGGSADSGHGSEPINKGCPLSWGQRGDIVAMFKLDEEPQARDGLHQG